MVSETKILDFSGSAVIEIEFIVTDKEAQQLFDLIHKEKILVFYACIPATFGVIDVNEIDPPAITPSDLHA